MLARSRALSGLLFAAALAGGCAGPRLPPPPPGDHAPWLAALGAAAPAAVQGLPSGAAGFDLPATATLVLFAEGEREPLPLDPERRAGLAGFVARGGRLLLLGHAARVAAWLGIEPEPPEARLWRHGFDARSRTGFARLGLQVTSGRLPELTEGLPAAPGAEHVHWLAQGAPLCWPVCGWVVGAPQQGEVLARLAAEREGAVDTAGEPVLVRWRHQQGIVLACGVLPDVRAAEPLVRDAAQGLVRRAVALLRGAAGGPVVLMPLPTAAPPAPVEPPARLADRELPQAPLLAHWGWQAPLWLHDGGGRVRPPAELVDEVLLPSWRSGADLLELGLAGPAGAAPWPWRDGDPLKRPPSFRAEPLAGWEPGAFGSLCAEAHVRGLLVQAALDPLPVGERIAERLVALRFLARELGDLRRLGTLAVDGFGVRQWWPDGDGFATAMLQDFQPAGYVYTAGETAPPSRGGLRALDAADGAPLGLDLPGLAHGWRDGFPADRFPLGVLDAGGARHRRGDQGCAGGGSGPDWLVAQAHDFARARRGLGGALWWRAHDPAALAPATVAYAHGLGLESLRAAVAMPLPATGQGGVRAAAAALLGDVGPQFAAGPPAAAAVHVLQNNWFRLLGSGGALQWDPRGLARFDAAAVVLSPAFLRTRFFGGRPDGAALREVRLDLLAAGSRGEGGYGEVVRVGAAAGDRRVPAVLAEGEAPAWPAAAAIELAAAPGYHELELALRGVRGQGLLAVSLDGTLLHCAPFTAATSAAVQVPLHLATAGSRILQLQVGPGGAVAIDGLRLLRRGDVAAEAAVVVPAGSGAVLQERSASSYHRELVELRAIADWPAVVLRVRCEHAVRNLQVERTFALPGYRPAPLPKGAAKAAAGRAAAVVRLVPADRSWPELLAVLLQRTRYERLEARDGALLWHAAPEPGHQGAIGFLFAAAGDAPTLAAHAETLLAGLAAPLALDPGPGGRATLVGDLPVAWTRLLHLPGAARTPYLVRENGWWLWRGAQPAPDGGDWLRVTLRPGDAVEVVGGPLLLASTRPGPGSLHTVALRDPEPLRTVARVLQPNRLAPPAVTFAADFDEVRLDGQPWAHFDGRTVFLPDRVGTYRIEARRHGGAAAPHVRRTRAPLRRAAWLPDRRELVLEADVEPERPAGLPYTAVLAGPEPLRIDNGERVDEASLRHADAAAAAAAAAGGVVVRFRPGVTKVHYGP